MSDSIITLAENGAWVRKDAGGVRRYLSDLNKGIRDVGRGVRESVAPMRWMNEKMFSGYGEQMQQLREVDDQILRWTRDLDNILDRAREARKQGRYLDVFYWLNQINARLKLAVEKGREIQHLSKEKLDEYFGKTQHGLHEYPVNLTEESLVDPNEAFANEVGTAMIVTSGFVQNVAEKLTTWKLEKMHRQQIREMKRALDGLLGYAANTVGHIDAMLSRMSKARADGDVGSYLAAFEKVGLLQEKFQSQWLQTYEKKGFREMANRIKAREQAEAERAAKQPRELAVHNLGDAMEEEVAQEQAAKPVAPTSAPPEVSTPSIPAPEATPASSNETQEKYEEPVVHTPEAFVGSEPIKQWVEPKSEQKPEQKSSLIESEEHLSAPEDEALPGLKPEQSKPKTKSAPKRSRKNASDVGATVTNRNHAEFYQKLAKIAETGNIYLMASALVSYSEAIDEEDPEKSMQLLAIAEGILDA